MTRYYVHALLNLKSTLEYHSKKGYRYKCVAYLKAHWIIMNHPWGQAVVTTSADHPEVER